MPRVNFIYKNKTKIAYRFSKRNKKTIVFLHGLMSDMNGTKAKFLNQFCLKNDLSFLTFDFRGHGKSDGNIINFGISDWIEDLKTVVNYHKLKKFILIGSSMGGWVAMKYATEFPNKVIKLLGIAAAPDFTTDLIWDELTHKQKSKIRTNRVIKKRINKDFFYYYSPNLFKNSKSSILKNSKKKYNGETILFHGGKDLTVPVNYNDHYLFKPTFKNLKIIKIQNADHSMADQQSLKTIIKFI